MTGPGHRPAAPAPSADASPLRPGATHARAPDAIAPDAITVDAPASPLAAADTGQEHSATIRPAVAADVPELLRLVRELADYEREPDAVAATEADFAAALFPPEGAPTAYALVAQVRGRVVGMAVWFLSFSTWTGKAGIHLEDLYVEPAHRGRGLGKALLATLARLCVERDYRRLEWWVLRWNTPSIAFYDALGASAMDEWIDYRLDGDALRALGAGTGEEEPAHGN